MPTPRAQRAPLRLFSLARLGQALALLCLWLLAAPSAGCVVDDEIPRYARVFKGGLTHLERVPGQTGPELHFSLAYLLGLADEEGIGAIDWQITLRSPEGQVLSELTQNVRAADPTEQRVLVVGERSRSIPLPAGLLREGQGYILWFVFYYRGEILTEILAPFYAIDGPQIEEPFDPREAL